MCLRCLCRSIKKLCYYFGIGINEISELTIILFIPYLLIWYIMTLYLYQIIRDLEKRQKYYILNNLTYYFFNYLLILTPIFILLLIHRIIKYVYQETKYELRVRELIMTKDYIIKENLFLKKKKQIPKHIKKNFLDYLIKLEESCSVCLSKITQDTKNDLTFCGHVFHHKCLNKSLDYNNKCPYCREKIDYDEFSSDSNSFGSNDSDDNNE